MDTTLTLTLGFSILINILTLRWAYQEHTARRRYQQETQILRQALRGMQPESKSWSGGFALLVIWLLVGIFLAAMTWLLMG